MNWQMDDHKIDDEIMINQYLAHLNEKDFPCVAAKVSVGRKQVKSMVGGHMACPADDQKILQFMYDFVDLYRSARQPFHSAAVIFRAPLQVDDVMFDTMLWQRLHALREKDCVNYQHDPRVDDNPTSPNYSYSLKGEAFFVIGLHPGSGRRSRQFTYPVLVFNPHAEFEKLRSRNRFEKLKAIIRKRDMKYSGSVNPLLGDFGATSEIHQYSGLPHRDDWKCPLSK